MTIKWHGYGQLCVGVYRFNPRAMDSISGPAEREKPVPFVCASQQCTHKFSRLSIGSIHVLWSRFLVQQREKCLFYLSVLTNSVPALNKTPPQKKFSLIRTSFHDFSRLCRQKSLRCRN